MTSKREQALEVMLQDMRQLMDEQQMLYDDGVNLHMFITFLIAITCFGFGIWVGTII